MTVSFEALAGVVRDAITTLPPGHELAASDVLSSLGIDSITTLNILVQAAEQFSLDLEKLSEDAPPPASLGELHQLLLALGGSEGQA